MPQNVISGETGVYMLDALHVTQTSAKPPLKRISNTNLYQKLPLQHTINE